jgi:hypothetical protein
MFELFEEMVDRVIDELHLIVVDPTLDIASYLLADVVGGSD